MQAIFGLDLPADARFTNAVREALANLTNRGSRASAARAIAP